MDEDIFISPPVVDGGYTYITNEYFCGCVPVDNTDQFLEIQSQIEEVQILIFDNALAFNETSTTLLELMDATLLLLNLFLILGVSACACATVYVLVLGLQRFIIGWL